MSNTVAIAKLVEKLTYAEMMTIAWQFSQWTAINEDGSEHDPDITPEAVASNFALWAQDIIDCE